MVRLAAGVPNNALLELTADLAARLEVARVIGISACQPVQIYGSLTSGVHNDALLQETSDPSVRLRMGRAIGISACQPAHIYHSADRYVLPELVAREREQIDQELKAAEKAFRSALEGKVAAVEWRSAVVTCGSIADYVVEQMRAADLLVTAAQEGSLLDRWRYVGVADLVLRAGRPVLVAAASQSKLDLRTVVVSWKDAREARRAVQDALPLLRLAERVVVVEVVASADLADARARTHDVVAWLTSHGIAATAQAIAARTGEAVELRNIASDLELDAGLIVGGAYGHTRLREWVLGGVTRDFLLQPDRCSFVSH
ncbi:MAG: universal stress protein [Reyranellaceae bacterium]